MTHLRQEKPQVNSSLQILAPQCSQTRI